MDLQRFADSYCKISTHCTPDGECHLTATCALRGSDGQIRTFSKSVALSPIIQWIDQKLSQYHQYLNHRDPVVSGNAQNMLVGWGFGDLVNTVKKGVSVVSAIADKAKEIAKSKAVGDLLNNKYVKSIASAIPGGNATLALAQKAHDAVADAKAGDPVAVQQVAQVKALADAGNPKAQTAIDQMKIMSAAMDVKAALPPALQNPAPSPYVANIAMTNPAQVFVRRHGSNAHYYDRGLGKVVIGTDWDYLRSRVRAMAQSKGAPAPAFAAWSNSNPQPRSPVSRDHRAQPGGAPPMQWIAPPSMTPSQPNLQIQDPSSLPPQDGYDDGSYGDDATDQVAGWLYNKGYRSVAQTLLDKFPGVGYAQRALYGQGLNTPAKAGSKIVDSLKAHWHLQ